MVGGAESAGFATLENLIAGIEMGVRWVLGHAFGVVVEWLSVGYGAVVVDTRGILRSWLGGRHCS